METRKGYCITINFVNIDNQGDEREIYFKNFFTSFASMGNFVSYKILHNTDISNSLYKFQRNNGVTKGEYYASVFLVLCFLSEHFKGFIL